MMNRLVRPLLLSASLLLCAGAAHAQAMPFEAIDGGAGNREYNGYVLREYTRVVGRFRDDWLASDARGFSRTFSPTATLTLFDQTQLHGRDAIAGGLGSAIPKIGDLQLGMSEFTASGALAYATGPISYVVQAADGTETKVQGTFTLVLSQDRGDWAIRSLALWQKPATATAAAPSAAPQTAVPAT
jgi:ketosteroid isomerase-like protein